MNYLAIYGWFTVIIEVDKYDIVLTDVFELVFISFFYVPNQPFSMFQPGQTNERTNARTSEWTNERTNEWMNERRVFQSVNVKV